MPATIRTIVEGDRVSADIDAAIAQYPRFSDLWEAWKWRLARSPYRDAVKIREGVYLIKTTDLTAYGLPSELAILYHANDERVVIDSIRVA